MAVTFLHFKQIKEEYLSSLLSSFLNGHPSILRKIQNTIHANPQGVLSLVPQYCPNKAHLNGHGDMCLLWPFSVRQAYFQGQLDNVAFHDIAVSRGQRLAPLAVDFQRHLHDPATFETAISVGVLDHTSSCPSHRNTPIQDGVPPNVPGLPIASVLYCARQS
jgi:hypothetical protein